MSSKDSASTSIRRVVETPLPGAPEGKAFYVSTHVTSAQRDRNTISRQTQQRSKPPSTTPVQQTPLPFDPEADFNFESTAVSPISSLDDPKEALRDSYCRICRRLQVTPCSAFIKQLGGPALSLNELKLGQQEFKAILTTLVNDTELVQVDLSGNPATSKEAGYIGELLNTNKYLTHLILTDMNLTVAFDLTGKALAVLAKTIKSCINLSNLDLSSNFLCDRDCGSICAIIEDTDGIRELILHHNQLGECGAHIGRAIADNMTLTSLDLSWNHIRGPGAIGIARGLQRNQHITKVNLSWNGFGFEGCTALGHALAGNTSLLVLDLTSNRIHLPALHKLLDGLVRNKTLKTLLLGTNPIPAHCTTYILDRINKWKHGNLKELDLQGVVVDKYFESTLNKIQENRLFMVRYDTALPLQKHAKSKLDPKNIFNIDPVRILFFMKQHLRTIDLFLKIDKDMSGTLTKDEMKYAFELEGYPISDMALEQVMRYLDTNQDGDVDLGEFFNAERRAKRERIKEAEDKQATPELKTTLVQPQYSQAFKKPPLAKSPSKTPGMTSRSNTFV